MGLVQERAESTLVRCFPTEGSPFLVVPLGPLAHKPAACLSSLQWSPLPAPGHRLKVTVVCPSSVIYPPARLKRQVRGKEERGGTEGLGKRKRN